MVAFAGPLVKALFARISSLRLWWDSPEAVVMPHLRLADSHAAVGRMAERDRSEAIINL